MTSTGWEAADLAMFDQFTAAANQVAAYAEVLRDKLEAHGFTRREAISMTSEWLQITMARAIK